MPKLPAIAFRTYLKLFYRGIIGIAVFILLYLLLALVLSIIPVNTNYRSSEKEVIEIYILSNGVHTDIVLPMQNEYKNWGTHLHTSDTRSGNTAARYVSFGWGDKGFYLDTPTWGELKFSTALKAMCYLSSSAMHVTFYQNLLESKSCKKIRINTEQYLLLVNYLEKSFTPDKSGKYILLTGAAYGQNDAFYEAKRTYNLFFTCNTWANQGLKVARLKACLWTPFDKGIFYHYTE